MLTIKQITENTDAVIRGLEKKHFKDAAATIAKVIEVNDKRRNTQNQLDKNLAEVNSLSRTIGQLMKEGKKEEDIPTSEKDELKDVNKKLDELKIKKEAVFAGYASKNKVVRQLIDLALLQNNMLKGEALNNFVKRSIEIIRFDTL